MKRLNRIIEGPSRFLPSRGTMYVNTLIVCCAATLLTTIIFPSRVHAEPVDPRNPAEGRFFDDWMEVFIGAGKVGYAHSTMSREKDLIKTELNFQLHLGRADQPVKIGVAQTTTETLAGAPIEFSTEMDLAKTRTKTKGVVRDGKVTITSTQFGMDSTSEYPFPTGALMSWGLFRESMLRGFKPGTEYALYVYSPDLRLDGPTKATTRIGEKENFDYRGKQVQGQRVTAKMETPIGAMELVSWIDADGNPVKATMPMPGVGDFILYSCDEAVALAEFAPPEFFMNTVIPVTRSLERASINQIKYVLSSKEPGAALADFPATGMQTSRRLSDSTIELIATRQKHRSRQSSAAAGNDGLKPDEFLSSNLMMNIEDPKLIELAKQAKGDATDPFEIGDRLRQFVTEYVKTKSLNIGFATASEVARSREGDCSEHGVLLAALGRICGLPSRVVVGLAYVPLFGGQDDIYGYHMWAQFQINGEWFDFDAALRETDVSPARIVFATSSLKDAGLADLSLPLMGKIGSIDMRIIEIDGKPVSESK